MASEFGYGTESQGLNRYLKKRRSDASIFVYLPIGMRWAKKKRPLESCHFLDI
jgi:hypothetical protein